MKPKTMEKIIHVSLRLDKEMMEEYAKCCKAGNISKSLMLRLLINDNYLDLISAGQNCVLRGNSQ